MESDKNILRGPELSITLPADLSLGQFLLDRIASYEDRVALVNGITNEELTFAEILSNSLRLAVYLTNQGLRKDDRIAVCSENSLTYVVPLCSAFFLGVANCPLNPGYTRRELLHALNISKAKYIFASESVVKILNEIARELPWSPRVISMEKYSSGNTPCISDLIGPIEAPNLDDFKICDLNPSDHVVAILCSSGTTGLPKGVMLTDKNFLAITCSLIENAKNASISGDETFLTLLPYFHAYAFVTMINQLVLGAKAVMLPRFEPQKFLAIIQKYKISTLMLVPPLAVFMAKSPLVEKYDLSSVKSVWCGAAPLSLEIQNSLCRKLNLKGIHQAYGLTETTLGVVMTPVDNNKPGSVGVLRAGISAKVMPLEESGLTEPLGPNQSGELCFKGDQIMKGYSGDVSSTAAMLDKEGWLHTGDIGYYDEDGFFFIVDRLKELIKYKAFQVAPAELEAILLMHPKIVDAAVIGSPDEKSGELPLAFVVKQEGSKVTASEVEKFVNEQVSNEKWLRGGVRFVKAIPKTASGKILRRELREALKSKL